MNIRKAESKDIDKILDLLSQVLEVHAKIRPDIFVSGSTKYKEDDIQKMIDDDNLIYVIEDNCVVGYAFCEIITPKFTNTMVPMKLFHIDDFCVDEKYRKRHIGEELFNFLKEEAKRLECNEIILSCWEGNETAKKFYEKMGMKARSTVMEYIIK